MSALAARSTDPTTGVLSGPPARPSATLVLAGGVASTPISDDGVEPLDFEGNDDQPGDETATGTCQRLTGITNVVGLKLDDPGENGSLGLVTFERDPTDPYPSLSAPAGITVELVSLKGGNGGDADSYNPPALQADGALAPPPEARGGPAPISHVLVRYTSDGTVTENTTLAVEKTAAPSFTRTYDWPIAKTVDDASVTVPLSRRRAPHGDAAARGARALPPRTVLVLLPGIDETNGQLLHARTSYRGEEIVEGARFASVFDPPSADGVLSIDVTRLDATDAGARAGKTTTG